MLFGFNPIMMTTLGGPIGQKFFAEVGEYQWTVPEGVKSVCISAIGAGASGGGAGEDEHSGGGGALAYSNNISVTPGEQLIIKVPESNSGDAYVRRNSADIVLAKGASQQIGGRASDCIGDASYTGGNGSKGMTPVFDTRGGGGAAGFSGNGGNGSSPGQDGADGAGGAGGGGFSGTPGGSGGGNGGVVQGANGAGGTSENPYGKGGSFGLDGSSFRGGGIYGGGGSSSGSGAGAQGCVYIIWGKDRSFPHNSAFVGTFDPDTPLGTFIEGGYYLGTIVDPDDMMGGLEYALIWAPRASGESSSGMTWGLTGDSTGFRSYTSGLVNTLGLVARSNTYPAAEYCAGLVIDGIDDWYLPARDELQLGYDNRGYLPSSEDFQNSFYWSSSEHNGTNGRRLDFSNGDWANSSKLGTLWVRGVRRVLVKGQ